MGLVKRFVLGKDIFSCDDVFVLLEAKNSATQFV